MLKKIHLKSIKLKNKIRYKKTKFELSNDICIKYVQI